MLPDDLPGASVFCANSKSNNYGNGNQNVLYYVADRREK
jgi:hypothetical protein